MKILYPKEIRIYSGNSSSNSGNSNNSCSQQAREIAFKIEIKMADETFSRDRSFVIIISRSANWFIRFNRGGRRGGLRNDRRIHSRATLSFIYRCGSGNTHRYWNRKRNEGKLWWLVTTRTTRIVAAIKFMAESNCRVDFASSKVIDRSVSLFAFDFFFFFFFSDQIRLNWTRERERERPSLFLNKLLHQFSPHLFAVCFSRKEKLFYTGVSVVRTHDFWRREVSIINIVFP